MNINEFDRMMNVSFADKDETMVDMLRATWNKLHEGGHPMHENSYWPADYKRIKVYSNVNLMEGTKYRQALQDWMDLDYTEQNSLLIDAFPDGEM